VNAHQVLMSDYYAAREWWELSREAASNGHTTEATEWAAEHPRPTFREFLINQRRQ
jgi:hypothetical protein